MAAAIDRSISHPALNILGIVCDKLLQVPRLHWMYAFTASPYGGTQALETPTLHIKSSKARTSSTSPGASFTHQRQKPKPLRVSGNWELAARVKPLIDSSVLGIHSSLPSFLPTHLKPKQIRPRGQD